MTMLLLWIFGSICFAMAVAFCTWGAAQAGAGREFARLGADGRLDVMDAFHEELMERADRTLAGIS